MNWNELRSFSSGTEWSMRDDLKRGSKAELVGSKLSSLLRVHLRRRATKHTSTCSITVNGNVISNLPDTMNFYWVWSFTQFQQ